LKQLEKKIKSGKLTKANINNKGYNKYLRMEGEVTFFRNFKVDGCKIICLSIIVYY
jgi:hypothetical protein